MRKIDFVFAKIITCDLLVKVYRCQWALQLTTSARCTSNRDCGSAKKGTLDAVSKKDASWC
jgi:hypothetical protein